MSSPIPQAEFRVDFPTLYVNAAWVEEHCTIPDGFRAGAPWVDYDWQLWCRLNHYRVRPDAVWVPERPILAPAFHYRRSQVVGPQKTGKGPGTATMAAAEGVGPALFAGWAGRDDGYVCAENGCGCGWEYPYELGEAKGMPWPSPLIQITATAVEQTDNVYRPLQAMARSGPLADLMRVGEEFIRLPGEGRIDVVTSSATARLGQPLTCAFQDETGLWTASNRMVRVAETQRRGLAGMGGRAVETTNAWDPAEESVAQRTAEAALPDVFRFHRLAPGSLSFGDKRERRRILRHVYDGSAHVDLDAIEAEAAELMLRDPHQAERFFGNRIVHGLGSWLPDGLWERTSAAVVVPDGARVCLGFDGSEHSDWTALRAETFDGHRFTPTYGPDRRPTVWDPAAWGGDIPRAEVDAAVDEVCHRYRVARAYCDPRGWQSEIEDWAARFGSEVFVEWATYRPVQMHAALDRAVVDMVSGRSTHDTCPTTATHVANARKVAKPGDRYILGKPTEHQKIDMAMADVLAHEATADALHVQPASPTRWARGATATR